MNRERKNNAVKKGRNVSVEIHIQTRSEQISIVGKNTLRSKYVFPFSFHFLPHLPGLVNVVDKLFNDGCCVGCLDIFGVVSNNGTGRGPNDDNAGFALLPI